MQNSSEISGAQLSKLKLLTLTILLYNNKTNAVEHNDYKFKKIINNNKKLVECKDSGKN